MKGVINVAGNKKHLGFETKQEAISWFRRVCAEKGYLLNASDIEELPNSPGLMIVFEYLGSPSKWSEYVSDMRLGESLRKFKARQRPYFTDKQQAIDWFRGVCIEAGRLVNTSDITLLSGAPCPRVVIKWLGPPNEWVKYVNDLEIDKKVVRRKSGRHFSFDGYVKIARFLMEQYGDVPTMRVIEDLLPDGPIYVTLCAHLGYKSDWRKYAGPEYDYVDRMEIALPSVMTKSE